MSPAQFQTHNRNITDSQLGDNATIHQGDVHHYYPSEPPQPWKPIRLIPYLQNKEFVDRPGLVEKLNTLLPHGSESFSDTVLWGLGGSGKTQIALEHAYRQAENRQCSVFWVHADTRVAFIQDYKKIANLFGLTGFSDGQDSELLRAVSNRIQSEPGWLLVLDNADDLSLFGVGGTQQGSSSLFDFVPHGTAVGTVGSVLWTSRDGQIAGSLVHPSYRAIRVPRMTSREARHLLAVARADDSAGEDKEQEQDEDEDEDGVMEKLLEELQWLPLGISQAGAYMRRAKATIREYLDMLSSNEERWPLLEEEQFDVHRKAGVPNSILKVWSISVAHIAKENVLASRLLRVMAYFDNRDMPFDMIVAAARHISTANVTKTVVQRAVIRLREFSFIKLRAGEKGGQSYEMHKLVQEATLYSIQTSRKPIGQDDDSNGSTACFAKAAIRVVDDLFPNIPEEYFIHEGINDLGGVKEYPDVLKRSEKYFPHAVKVADWTETPNEEERMCDLLGRVSAYLRTTSRWQDKESVDGRIFTLRHRLYGPNHVDTLHSEQLIAENYCQQNRFPEAAAIENRVLKEFTTSLGEQDLHTLWSMHNVANIMCKQLQFGAAQELQTRALRILENMPDHPGKLMTESLHCLARAYYGQQNFDKVGQVCTKSLKYCRDHLNGADSPLYVKTAIRTVGFRIEALVVQGRLQSQATAAVEDVVSEICDKIQALSHLHEIIRLEMLVKVKAAARKFLEVRDVQEKVVEFYCKRFGEGHQKTISAMEYLAWIYHSLCQYDKAEALLVKGVKLSQSAVGEEHPYTLNNMVGLATVYRSQKRFDESKQVLDKVLPLYTKILGRPFSLSFLAYNGDLSLGVLVDVDGESGIMTRDYTEAVLRQNNLNPSSASSAVPTTGGRSWVGRLKLPSVTSNAYRLLHIFGLSVPFVALLLSWGLYFGIVW
ncbi:hypothetical protein MKX08_010183 [Trichoderma sp. CBMAI-0020]|nr:hypothetical protein MKX08_010183 [Trichoderma sp. CBMAI-0020]